MLNVINNHVYHTRTIPYDYTVGIGADFVRDGAIIGVNAY